MAANVINAQLLSNMFLAGANNLESQKEYINELNVFPVPDGDTGTNMTLTIMSAAKEVSSLTNPDMAAVCKSISSGSLRGARGNSGVILSQLIRGFTKIATNYNELTIPVLADCFDNAVKTAYKAVMKPKEGTILTVAAGAAYKARELADAGEKDLDTFLQTVISHADYVLSTTPDLLPVLKQAGVVDSGGQGLLEVMKGAYDAFSGKITDFSLNSTPAQSKNKGANPNQVANADIKFGYCTEFIILLNKAFNVKHELDFKAYLESIGDSIVVVADGEIVKVHVHTNDPGLAIQRALKYGMLSNMKIDNMRLEQQEHAAKLEEKEQAPAKPLEPAKKFGFIAVSVGDGLSEIFKGLGVDHIIEGGQTMNPSTEDMLDAISRVNAENIYILPNNKNIVMAANQARDLTSDKKIIVIPTKTIPQGITALINFSPDSDIKENESLMMEAITSVKTGQVTYAVRDTMIDDKEIHQGDYMGIGDKGILSVGKEQLQVTFDMVCEQVDDDTELITIYYGCDVAKEEAEKLQEMISEKFDFCDVDLQYGGQPIYYYFVSVE